MHTRTEITPASKDRRDYQERILQRVSRTFALTIPQLPRALRCVVSNAYLLCRIADTIEDESALASAQKQYFHDVFCRVVAGEADAAAFGRELAPLLTCDALEAERELVRHTSEIIDITLALNGNQRAALERCLEVMCQGMPRYERHASVEGLRDLASLGSYCYCVAGVVGEMLTELFCDHAPAVAAHRARLMRLGVSFGQGLQMVNILKDFWEDYSRGVCWLPRSMFLRAGVNLAHIDAGEYHPGFGATYAELIGIAHAHLRNGLEYTLTIPRRETGIRRFCVLALALAVQTLQRVHERPGFTSSQQVKVSRQTVSRTLVMTNLLSGSDRLLRGWFERIERGLPIAEQSDDWAAQSGLVS